MALVKMVILDELALRFVEGAGFRHFCSVACPKFVVPSRRTLARDIMELHLKEKSALRSLFNKQTISLTTDIWTTNTTTVSYMVITAHFIDVNFQLHRRIISFKPVCDHKGETIAKQIESCLIDWGIKKVFTVTVDNATANDNTIRILKSNLGFWRDDPLLFDGEFMHVRCCAHILNLIARDGLADISDSVVSVRNAVKYVRSSNARFQAFQKRSDLDKLIRGSLILDNNIRWNYTYLMLTTTLKHRGAFDKMVVEDKLYDGYFLEDEKGKKRVGPPKLNDWENVRRFKIFKNLL
ncbi:unnamed protein product [Cuscuta europaea]|uniref:Zinc finger BED domain-containing protein RICESLEEPER 2-like n=1 Tax=Cuscuta europaea TaxID=41803 RepID=A0A9P1E7V2_CUSEU|nr:unnamed protein product [Cuscuta europaea]